MNRPHSPRPSRIPIRTWKIAAVTGAGAFMAMLDSTLANLALESIRDDFASTLSIVQWVVTGYLIALAVSLPTVGWLGRRYGYGRLWATGLAAFTMFSGLCAVAPGPIALIAARFLQGLAGGLMIPAGQAVIGSTARPNELGRLMGVLGLVVSLGPAVGPAIGGLLLEVASWRWLFWMNVPIGLATLALARGLVPGGSTSKTYPLDRSALVLISIGLPLLLYGAAELGATGLTRISTMAVTIGAVLTVGFILDTLRVAHPLIDLRLLRGHSFAAASATTCLTGANMYGGLLLLPLYLQLATGRDTIETGLLLLAMGLGSAVALPVAGALTDRHGAGVVSLAGAGLLLVTTLPFLLPGTLSTTALALILVARGVGMAWAQMPAMTAAYTSVTSEQMGDASTLINIVQRVGGALGAVGIVVVLTRADGGTGPSAYVVAFGVLTLVSALTLASAAILRRHTRRRVTPSR